MELKNQIMDMVVFHGCYDSIGHLKKQIFMTDGLRERTVLA
ncbi:hypothetical protein [uncultured Acetatifactor sp.]|nr:hypothetical protein [uncultured Acetatifactor sp.]